MIGWGRTRLQALPLPGWDRAGLSDRNRRLLDAVMLGGLLVAGSYVARRATDEAWHMVADSPPPDPDDPDTDLRDALLWSLISGLLVGLTRLLLRREIGRFRRSAVAARIGRAVS